MVSFLWKAEKRKGKGGKKHVFTRQSENKGPEKVVPPWFATVIFVSNSRLGRQGMMALGKQNREVFTI